MNYSFEYIDLILLAMIAGFIFLRLRGILGRKTGFENKVQTDFTREFVKETPAKVLKKFHLMMRHKKISLKVQKSPMKILLQVFQQEM